MPARNRRWRRAARGRFQPLPCRAPSTKQVYGAALEATGYPTWDSLTDCDPDAVAGAVAQVGAKGCSPARVAEWQLHAQALASGLPALRPGARWPVTGPYIAIDLEYDVTPGHDHIWLAGAALVYPDGADHHSWWADTPSQEREILTRLTMLLDQHPHLRLITWAGSTADIPGCVPQPPATGSLAWQPQPPTGTSTPGYEHATTRGSRP